MMPLKMKLFLLYRRYRPIPLVEFIVVYVVIMGAAAIVSGEGWPSMREFLLWLVPFVCGWAFRSARGDDIVVLEHHEDHCRVMIQTTDPEE